MLYYPEIRYRKFNIDKKIWFSIWYYFFLQAYRSADYDKPRSSRASDASVSTLNKL